MKHWYELNILFEKQSRNYLCSFAIIWIMLFHAYYMRFDAFPLNISNIFFNIGYFGVDIFILLSGIGNYFSCKSKNIYCYYKKRVLKIYPIFFIMVSAYSIYLFAIKKSINLQEIFWNISTLYYWFHQSNTFNWYVPAILVLYLLTPLFYKIINCNKKSVNIVFVGLPVIIYSLFARELFPWCDFILRIPIYYIGMLLAHYNNNVKKINAYTLWGAFIVGFLFMGYLYSFRVTNEPLYNQFRIMPGILFIIPLCFFIADVCKYIKNKTIISVTKDIGEASFEIYLTHIIINREIRGYLLNSGLSILSIIAVFLLSNILTILAGIIVHRLGKKLIRNIAR